MAAHAPFWLVVMRNAALWRHWLLVNYLFAPGKLRDEEMARHIAVVRLIYGW